MDFRSPVNDTSGLSPDGRVGPIECLAGIIAEDDLIEHLSQARFGLDLLPRNKRFPGLNARADTASGGGVGKVFEQFGKLIG